MDNDDDAELQQALALSLQEFNQSQQSPQPEGTSLQKEQDKPLETGVKGKQSKGGREAAGSRTKAQTKQGRGRKPPSYSPSEPEIEACFKELVSTNRTYISIADMLEASNSRRIK